MKLSVSETKQQKKYCNDIEDAISKNVIYGVI